MNCVVFTDTPKTITSVCRGTPNVRGIYFRVFSRCCQLSPERIDSGPVLFPSYLSSMTVVLTVVPSYV